MSQKNLEDELHEAFKKHQERARERARARGQMEFTQEDYYLTLDTKLQDTYSEWKNSSFPNSQDDWEAIINKRKEIREKCSALRSKLKDVEYPFDVVRRFHTVNIREDLDYALFMCAIGETLKSVQSSQPVDVKLQPFFQSQSLLPQLLYLAERAKNAKVKFKDLDTVVLTSCENAKLDNYNGGNLIIDCDLEYNNIYYVGRNMKSGKIKSAR